MALNKLRVDQPWDLPARNILNKLIATVDGLTGGGIADGDKGDITVSGGGAVWTIDAAVVTLAKMADLATARLLGRVTAGAGVPEALTGTQATTLLDIFTSALKGLAPASGGGTTNFLRADGTWAAPAAGAATTTGTAELNFGAFPGSSHTTVAVTGQAAIVAGSIVRAWIRPVATADHTADEHLMETLRVEAADIVAGTGFTIHGMNTSQLNEPIEVGRRPSGVLTPTPAYTAGGLQKSLGYGGGIGTRIWGRWSVAWAWN